MEWTREHDREELTRGILTVYPFQYKHSTAKRGQAWAQIADIVNSKASPRFQNSQRSVPERFTALEKNLPKKWQMKRKYGINTPDLTNNEQGMEENIARKKDAIALLMKMNNSCKRKREQRQKKRENLV